MTDPSNVPAADEASALSGWRRLALGGLVVAAFALLLVLGTWQVQRMQWKEALLSRIEEQLSQQPLDLAEVEAAQSRGDPIEYQPVTLSGQFEHERERHFFATHEGQSGFYVYTPLRLADGRAVFVNRGFVPFDLKSPSTRPAGQVAGTVSVTGLAREQPAAKPSWLVPENDPAKNIFYWKDLGAMASSAAVPGSILPFFVDADATSSPGGWPVGGVTMVNLPNNHLQYAVTWYGLALALAAVSLLMLIRGRRHANSAPDKTAET